MSSDFARGRRDRLRIPRARHPRELERVVGLMASMGVRDVRLTGGEPLVRRDLPRLVSMLSPLLNDLSLTTRQVTGRYRRARRRYARFTKRSS